MPAIPGGIAEAFIAGMARSYAWGNRRIERGRLAVRYGPLLRVGKSHAEFLSIPLSCIFTRCVVQTQKVPPLNPLTP
jgi:hypothetical protein